MSSPDTPTDPQGTPPAGDVPPPPPPPTAEQPPPPPPGGGPRKLTRSTGDRAIAGVAGGLGRYFDIDPILFRIGFVILAFAGGAGVLAYLALWLLVPDDAGATVSTEDRSRLMTITGLAILVFAAIVILPGPGWIFGPGLFGLLLIVAAGLLLYQAAGGPRTGAARVLLVLAAILGAVLLGLCAAFAAALGGGTAVAVAVIALGAVMVVTAFTRGRRWLLLPALALAAPLAFVAAADLEFDGGFGDREYRPATIADVRDRYELGAGEMWIDLRDVDFPAGRTTVGIDLGAGSATLLVPEDVCVSADFRVGVGVVSAFGREDGGVDFEFDERPSNRAGSPELHLVGDVDLGALRIGDDVHVFDGPRRLGPPWLREEWGDEFDGIAFDRQPGCLQTA